MRIYCVGLDHRTSPLEVRERVAAVARPEVARPAKNGPHVTPVSAVVLSTCNRFEVYGHFDENVSRFSCADAYGSLVRLIADRSGISEAVFVPHLYRFAGRGAVEHLFRVAAGVESAIIGEPEVLGQVSRAGGDFVIGGQTGDVLRAAFRAAVVAGRRARVETGIGRGAVSLATGIADVAEGASDRERSNVVVVGAGVIGTGVAKVLRKRDRADVVVVNRTVQEVTPVSRSASVKGGGAHAPNRVRTFSELPDLLLGADAVVLATSSSSPILTASVVSRAVRARGRRPLVVVDAGVPRNSDPTVDRLEGVSLMNIDDVARRVDGTIGDRHAELPAVDVVVNDELDTFEESIRRRAAAPVISALRKKADRIREAEVQRAIEQMADLSPEARATLETVSSAIVRKLLHEPTQMLREGPDSTRSERIRIAETLFGLRDADSKGEAA